MRFNVLKAVKKLTKKEFRTSLKSFWSVSQLTKLTKAIRGQLRRIVHFSRSDVEQILGESNSTATSAFAALSEADSESADAQKARLLRATTRIFTYYSVVL